MTDRNLGIELRDDGKLVIKDIGDPVILYDATYRFFKERRPVKRGRLNRTYPETTSGEVRQLAEVWTRVHARYWSGELERAGHANEWKAARAKIEVATAGADPKATFPFNEEFWLRWTRRLSILLSVARDWPSKWDMAVDSVKASISNLPENLQKGANAIADAGASIATTAGEVAAAPVRGLFGGLFGKLGTPLLIGAVVVAGILVVPRLLPKRAPAALPPAGGTS